MLKPEDHPEAVQRFVTAVANLSRELIESGGVPHQMLAAGLRIEAGKIEVAGPRAPMKPDERELVDLARKTHEFVNSLQVAGIDETVAITVLGNTAIERVARRSGASGAEQWLRGLAAFVGANGSALEQTARHH